MCRTIVSVLACVSSLAAFIFVAFLRCPTKYQLFAEITISTRLMLYITAAALFRSIATMCQVTSYEHEDIKHIDHYSRSCIAIGFLNHFSAWIAILFTLMGTIHIFKVYFVFFSDMKRGSILTSGSIQQIPQSCFAFHRKFILESVSISILFAISLIFSLFPFIEKSYGISGGWCWIRTQNEDCSEHMAGVVLQYATWYVPSIIIKIVNTGLILASFIIIYKTSHDLKKIELGYDKLKDFKKAHAQLMPIMICSVVYLVLNWIGFANRVTIKVKKTHNMFLWMFHAFASSCWGLVAGTALIIYLFIRVYLKVKDKRREFSYRFSNNFDTSSIVSLTADARKQANYMSH